MFNKQKQIDSLSADLHQARQDNARLRSQLDTSEKAIASQADAVMRLTAGADKAASAIALLATAVEKVGEQLSRSIAAQAHVADRQARAIQEYVQYNKED